ncbi:hypothetical protein HK097_003604, partial [Rhizophlyctis rosea]
MNPSSPPIPSSPTTLLTPSPPPRPYITPIPPPLPPRTTSLTNPHAPRRPSDEWIAERREKVVRAYERQRASVPKGQSRNSLKEGGGESVRKEGDGGG